MDDCKIVIVNMLGECLYTPGKRVNVKSVSGVRIPLSPLKNTELQDFYLCQNDAFYIRKYQKKPQFDRNNPQENRK